MHFAVHIFDCAILKVAVINEELVPTVRFLYITSNLPDETTHETIPNWSADAIMLI
jgi:hypothetical protein